MGRMRFNIIYTPRTVAYLRLFVFSLLRWSDCSFRLVANGCSTGEASMLERLCQESSRLEFLRLPTGQGIIPHGHALNLLQSLERSERFCFMDSDILATGEFLTKIVSRLEGFAAVFSGARIGAKDEGTRLPEAFERISPSSGLDPDGSFLGKTFFAIYDNRILTELMQSTRVGFEIRRWEEVPEQCLDQLKRMGLRAVAEGCDTGKTLNLLLLARGERLAWVDSPSLVHIGGVSTRVVYKGSLRQRIRFQTRRMLGHMRQALANPLGASLRPQAREQDLITGYFHGLLRSLFESRPRPSLPAINEPEIQAHILSVTRHIVELYGEFGRRIQSNGSQVQYR